MIPTSVPHALIPHLSQLFFVVEYLGIFIAALGGALNAIRDQRFKYDIVGVVGLGMVSALGGGIMRDIILANVVPLAFENIWYLITAISGSLIAALFVSRLGKGTNTAMLVIDAAAIGLFSVSGTTRALAHGLSQLPALLLGVTTAVGGGSLRDVLSGRPPEIFQRGQFYAIAAFFGSAVFLVSDFMDMNRTFSTVLGASACFTLRMLATRYNWRTRHIQDF